MSYHVLNRQLSFSQVTLFYSGCIKMYLLDTIVTRIKMKRDKGSKCNDIFLTRHNAAGDYDRLNP